MRALGHPGLVCGALRPYAQTTVRVDPNTGALVIALPAGERRVSNGEESANLLGHAWVEELYMLLQTDRAEYDQALSFINGPGVKAAQQFLGAQ
jgi:hypothetical protein